MKSNHFETVESNDDLNGFGCRQWQIICHYIWLVQRCPFQRIPHTFTLLPRQTVKRPFTQPIPERYHALIRELSSLSMQIHISFVRMKPRTENGIKGSPVCKPLRHTNPLNDGKRVKNSSKSTHLYVFDSSILLKYFRTETINFPQRHWLLCVNGLNFMNGNNRHR